MNAEEMRLNYSVSCTFALRDLETIKMRVDRFPDSSNKQCAETAIETLQFYLTKIMKEADGYD